MRRFALLGTIAVSGSIAACLMSPESRELTIEKISENLSVIAGGDDGNTAVFVHAGGVVLVDTKGADGGQRILGLVRTVTDKPITHIVNTHTHSDHVGGNAFSRNTSR